MLPMLSPTLPLATPPWTGLGRRLESAVRKALHEFQMIEDQKIAVALSGGKDSLALLFLLKAISRGGFAPFELTALHVSGSFSCGAGIQENYLQAICKQIDVPFLSTTSKQDLKNLECYSCSRERRRLLFNLAKSEGIHTIAFGHHRDDNAQTLLLNLFHKGEFAGMLPKLKMEDYDVTIIRPLIYLSEKEIVAFAKEHKFLRVTCQCPVGQNSMRKQVDKIMDNLEEQFPNIRNNLSQASLQFGSDKAIRKEKTRPNRLRLIKIRHL